MQSSTRVVHGGVIVELKARAKEAREMARKFRVDDNVIYK